MCPVPVVQNCCSVSGCLVLSINWGLHRHLPVIDSGQIVCQIAVSKEDKNNFPTVRSLLRNVTVGRLVRSLVRGTRRTDPAYVVRRHGSLRI